VAAARVAAASGAVMPYRPPLGCTHPGCPHPVPCPDNPRTWRGRAMPRGWAATRARILRRDPICRLCLAAPSTEAHHTQPGNEDEATIVGACSPCHRAVSLQQAAAARAAAR
jgi:5-methylcytosine-specific restriction enzyme A